jgi:hypothetical protein
VTDLEALLAERRKDRADKDTEFALLDCLQDDDGFAGVRDGRRRHRHVVRGVR